MNHKKTVLAVLLATALPFTAGAKIDNQVTLSEKKTKQLEHELTEIKQQLNKQSRAIRVHGKTSDKKAAFDELSLTVHSIKGAPESVAYNPSALMAGSQVVTYIMGMPVVTSPYLGERPAFDGSDLIVNISSINQDVRLMMQRRALAKALHKLGYPDPDCPIIALSGKLEAVGFYQNPLAGKATGDLDLTGSEFDIAVILNTWVEGYLSLAYDNSSPLVGGPRVGNANLFLHKGFINIGNLDQTPFYMTAGQLYVPFGRYSSSMVSSPLPMIISRTKARPLILGYKNTSGPGLYAALYGFKSETTLNKSGIGGINVGYTIATHKQRGEIGASFISSMDDAEGMQATGGGPATFAGFGVRAATEVVKKIPAVDVHGSYNIDAWSITAEWVSATGRFRRRDLSFGARGAKPQAANVEAAYTFKAFNKPASVAVGYGWSKEALALSTPQKRIIGVFNISLWRDTVQSIEYRHDMDYKASQVANGITTGSGVANAAIRGTGRASDTVSAQMGVYF